MGCRKMNYFLELMNVDVARHFVGVVFHVLLMVPRAPIANGTVVVLSLHICSTSISTSLYLLNFSLVLTDVLGSWGIITLMRR